MLKFVKILLVIIIVCIVVSIPLGYSVLSNVKNGKDKVLAAEQLISEQKDFATAAQYLKSASEYFQSSRDKLVFFSFLKAIPWVSIQVKAAQAGITAAKISTESLSSLVGLAGDVRGPFKNKEQLRVGDLSEQDRMEILNNIKQATPMLREAKKNLDIAENLIYKVSSEKLIGYLGNGIKNLQKNVSLASRLLDDAMPLIEIAPDLVGFPKQKTYLFVLQNSDEMRPTGGFIGTYGLITFKAGHITDFFTDDVYNLDKLARPKSIAPKPLRLYLGQPKLYLRDANWSPDFPTSAVSLMNVYHDEDSKASEVDGVIAIMPETIKSLIEITGPITVKGQTFTVDNLTDALEYEVEIGFESRGIGRPQRKDIISELGHELIAKVIALPINKWPDALRAIRESLDQKQFIVFSKNGEIQKLIESYNWGANIKSVSSDYLGIFDANMFALKTDPYVSRNIFYNVKKVKNDLIGEVEIVYSYPQPGPAWKTKGYRSYTRVYVPGGSKLIRAEGVLKEEFSSEQGEVAITKEFDKTVFGAFIAVQAGKEHRLKFVYRLPETIKNSNNYSLYAQKQPGTIGRNLTVTVDFDKVARSWSPRGLSVSKEGSKLTWQSSLKQDAEFKVQF